MKVDILKSVHLPIKDIEVNKGQIEGLPKNPRLIKNERFEKLKKSIEDNPEMLGAREVLVYPLGSKYVVIGGNMRFQACKDLGFVTVPCKMLDKDMTVEQLRAITIKDNVSFGELDFDALANEWEAEELEEWGLELPVQNYEDLHYSDKNKEIEIDDLDNQMSIKLNYTESEYWQVKEALQKVAATPEQAVFQLLGLTNE
jgi:hypothetical protein